MLQVALGGPNVPLIMGEAPRKHRSQAPPPPLFLTQKAISVPMRPWTSPACDLSVKVVLEVLRAEAVFNTIIYMLAVVHFNCAGADLATDVSVQAGDVATLQRALDEADRFLAAGSETFIEAPLKITPAFLRQWLLSAGEFATQVRADILKRSSERLRDLALRVDSLCPRWGESITDDAVMDDRARVQILLNPSISELLSAVRNLAAGMASLVSIGEKLNLPCHDRAFVSTKEICRSAENSLDWGRRTVNVSAGMKLLLGPTPVLKSVVAVLGLRSSLPGGLVVRLEALRAELDPASGSRAAKAPQLGASAGPIGGSASSSSIVPAPPLKRGASQSSKSVASGRVAKRSKGPA